LSTKLGRKVEVVTPKRAEKRELVEHAFQNAREALGRKLAESTSQGKLLAGVAHVFGLERTPRRIEVYDNSHIMGTNAVGAMVVAGPEGFVKNQYRKFNIRAADLTPGDDFAMMREVLTRRFKRLLREHGLPAGEAASSESGGSEPLSESWPGSTRPSTETEVAVLALDCRLEGSHDGVEPDPSDETEDDAEAQGGDVGAWPDLVLIDGGAGQLSAAQSVLAELGLHGLAIAGIAKGPDRNAGRERFFMPGKPPFSLPPNDPVLYFVQRLRDEAHRFAIGSHRAKRKKAMAENLLDDIPGIGPTRKRALLKHFGSAKSVGRAGVSDLQAVAGISAAMAQQIYDYFHDRK
jgi:excinuclease ABC subunit C